MKKRVLHLSFGLCVLFFVSIAASADPPWPEDLLGPPDSKGPAQVQLPPQAKGHRNRTAKVRLDLLEADRITLNLFDDVTLVAVRDRLVDNVKGRTVWIGHIEGEEDSEVILAAKGKAMMGTVRIGEEMYEIVYAGNDTHVVREIDRSMTLDDADPLYPPESPAEGAPIDDQTSTPGPGTAADTAGTVIDLMVVYTPKALANAGSTDGIEAKIANAVAAANQAYIRSGIDMQLNLVHVAEVSYAETGDMYQTLKDLTGTSDGEMDDIHNWRNQFGADQVALISTDANYCGIAWTMTSGWVSSGFAPYAFAVVHDDSRFACLSNHTFAHELGHNQGSQHNEENGSSGGAYPYSYGYRVCETGGFRTIMSYTCPGAARIGYFSNPDVYYDAAPTGIRNEADNALSMNNTRTVVASWRTSVSAAPPSAPTSLEALPQSDSEISLTWSDRSTDETGFRVQRSVDGADWAEVASLGSDVTAYSDGGLASETLYYYRVFAYNGAGTSAYSNTASAITDSAASPADVTPPRITRLTPADGAEVSDFVWIEVDASDDVALQSVELEIDGKAVAFSSSSPLRYKWNAKKLSGRHTITARAADTTGNTDELTHSVTVGSQDSSGTSPSRGKGHKK